MIGNRFRRSDRIGGDRTGEVWEATDEQTGQPCMVKLVDPLVFPTPMLMQRALRELKKLEEISSPHIARILAHGRDGEGEGGQLWVAMERAPEARSLGRAIAEYGVMPAPRAAATVVAIARGLGEAARVGVMHRDLSPKNVLIDPSGGIKLINFCFPVPAGDIPGEPEFLAPELVEGKPVDQRTNIYSLGAIYYFVLTGQPPFSGDPAQVRQAHLQGGPRAPSQLAEVPPDVEALVLKALERQSSKRFMTLRQLLTEVERVGGGSSAGSTQPMGAAGKSGRGELGQTMAGFGSPAADGGAVVGPPAPAADAGGKASKGSKRRAMSKTMIGGFAALDSAAPGVEQDAEPPTEKMAAPPAAVVDDAATRRMAVPEPQPEPQPRGAASNLVPEPAPAVDPPHGVQRQPEPEQLTPQQPEPQRPQPPVAARPVAPQSAAGGKGKGARPPVSSERRQKKAGFRETMWFKKGDLDAVAAEEAAVAAQQGKVVADKADEIPIEDRYGDDGTLSSGDQHRYSLKTGHTQHMPAIQETAGPVGDVSEDELIGEMKSGRMAMIGAVIGGLAILIAIVVWYVSQGGEEKADEPATGPAGAAQPGAADPPAPPPAGG